MRAETREILERRARSFKVMIVKILIAEDRKQRYQEVVRK